MSRNKWTRIYYNPKQIQPGILLAKELRFTFIMNINTDYNRILIGFYNEPCLIIFSRK